MMPHLPLLLLLLLLLILYTRWVLPMKASTCW
jgi:hypothetical protein